MNWTVRLALPFLLGLVLSPVTVRADAIMVTRAMLAETIAEVFVTEDSVRVELEIGGNALPAFRDLMPDELHQRMGYEPEPFAVRVRRFMNEGWIVRDAKGQQLRGRLLKLEPRLRLKRDEITGESLPVTEGEQEYAVFAVLGYALPGQPASLSITPPRVPVAAGGRADIGFVLYHEGLPVTDFRYLGTTETVDLDWDDPWYSRFRNRNLKRQYDTPLNIFLYVEPYEVRVEVIARPADLQDWVDLGVADLDTISAGMQRALLDTAAAFLARNLELTVDGRPVAPVLDRVNFLHRTLRNSTVIDPPEPLSLVSATFGAIFVVPTEGLPKEAAVTWHLFPERAQYVYSAATDEAGPMPYRLAPDDNVLQWTNFLTNPTIPTLVAVPPPPRFGGLRVPVLTVVFVVGAVVLLGRFAFGRAMRRGLVLAIAGAMVVAGVLLGPLLQVSVPVPWLQSVPVEDIDAPGVVSGLLTNVYRAFDFRDEEQVYDVLARSASGDLLTRIYLETRRGLELQNQGGARVKVKAVILEEVTPESLAGRMGFRARCTWHVAGSVGHWGHVHQRTNRYVAVLTLEPVDGAWKITDLELVQEERVL